MLYDASPSMEIEGRRPARSWAARPTSPRAIAPIVEPSSWSRLREKMDVVVQPFSAAKAGHGTDRRPARQGAPDRQGNLRWIVLASDGDWNEGPPPVAAAAKLQDPRRAGLRRGRSEAGSGCSDIELLSLDAPTFGVAGKSVRIPFTIESSLPREFVTTVTLRTSEGDEVQKEVKLAPMGRTTDWVVWKPRATGDVTLTLEVPRHPDETLTDNNKLERADRDPRGEAQGPARRVVPAVGVSLPPQRAVARPGRRGLVPPLPPGPDEAGRREQGLHQAVPGRARRALQV